MAFVSTGQSKYKNYERRRCQAPRSRSDTPPTLLAIRFASLNGSHQKAVKT